ncbi:MAG: TIM barrel protein [Capsulimonadaceae bacterium]|nr:TIM barrel protein [Capsulimonadaceae bacterium]
MKQSFTWWSFAGRGIGDDDLLAGARKIGYEGVELLPPALFERARDYGFTIASHGGHESIEAGFNNPADHDRIVREIEANLKLAVKFGIPNLIVFSGNRRIGQSDAEGARVVAEGVRRIVRAAEEAGVTLVMELLNSKVDHPGYQCDHSSWLMPIIDEIDSPKFKALYDVYHMQIMEGDLVRTFEANVARIAHVHTAGNPGRNELVGTKQEIFYPAVFRGIATSGYDGFVCHELIPTGSPLDALREAYELCREAAKQALASGA